MKAMVIEKFGDVDELHFADLPVPKPADNEVQIQVMFCGVNPVDWKICKGYLKDRLPYKFPITLGWDVAGVVSEVGKNVKNWKVGDEVFAYCRKPTVHAGAYAEYICFDAEHVARKPKNMTFAQSASTPLAALTAWQSLFDSARSLLSFKSFKL
jgi:NADPH2:quinone reductase